MFFCLTELLKEIRIRNKKNCNNKDAGKADCMFPNSTCGWYEAKRNYLIHSDPLIWQLFLRLKKKKLKT